MVGVIQDETKTLTLAEITRREVDYCAGETNGGKLYAVLDDVNQVYAIIYVTDDHKTYVDVMARIEDDKVIIERDGALDNPLYEALMVNGGVPREKIVLAYKGEALPDNSKS